jgi:hypothetical protein
MSFKDTSRKQRNHAVYQPNKPLSVLSGTGAVLLHSKLFGGDFPLQRHPLLLNRRTFRFTAVCLAYILVKLRKLVENLPLLVLLKDKK